MNRTLEIAIYKARLAAREAGNVRARRNEKIQKSASHAARHARKALRTHMRSHSRSVQQWDQELFHAQSKYFALSYEQNDEDISHAVHQFDMSLVAFSMDEIEPLRREAMVQLEVDEVCVEMDTVLKM